MKIEFTGDLKRIDVRPDDVFVLMTEHRITDEIEKRLREHFERWFPGHKCVVLGDGLKLGVVRQEEAA